jgi:hypothetical protein
MAEIGVVGHEGPDGVPGAYESQTLPSISMLASGLVLSIRIRDLRPASITVKVDQHMVTAYRRISIAWRWLVWYFIDNKAASIIAG